MLVSCELCLLSTILKSVSEHSHFTMPEVYTVKVAEATPATADRPSAGPVYRCIYAKDGLMELPADLHSPWQFFRLFCFFFLSVSLV